MKNFALTFLLLLAAPAQAQDAGHTVSEPAVSPDAVTLESFNQRVEQGAVRLLKTGAQAERSIDYDVAFPDGESELRQMNGYGILLVSASTHDDSELPLAKVYLSNGNGPAIALRLVGSAARNVPLSSAAAKMFGAYRRDGFHLLPLDRLKDDSRVTGDFAKARSGFLIVDGGLSPPQYGLHVASASPPPRAVVQHMIDREYPGFGVVLDAGLK